MRSRPLLVLPLLLAGCSHLWSGDDGTSTRVDDPDRDDQECTTAVSLAELKLHELKAARTSTLDLEIVRSVIIPLEPRLQQHRLACVRRAWAEAEDAAKSTIAARADDIRPFLEQLCAQLAGPSRDLEKIGALLREKARAGRGLAVLGDVVDCTAELPPS